MVYHSTGSLKGRSDSLEVKSDRSIVEVSFTFLANLVVRVLDPHHFEEGSPKLETRFYDTPSVFDQLGYVYII